MIIRDFRSECIPELNAKILRVVEKLVCRYRDNLPNGWRCCVEFQHKHADRPCYVLDLQSNQGGGDFAPIKMQTLKLFPEICTTGNITLPRIREILAEIDGVDDDFCKQLSKMLTVSQLTAQDWGILKEFGITHWYGGVRIPYDILTTDVVEPFLADESAEQFVKEKKGEIRITFSGAKEWQDTFFCFSIFKQIQKTLNSLWSRDQIWYNLRGFNNNPCVSFWVENLNISEALKD